MSEGVIAAVLLVAGGLGALQTAAISIAIRMVMLFIYGLYQGLLGESGSKVVTGMIQLQTGSGCYPNADVNLSARTYHRRRS